LLPFTNAPSLEVHGFYNRIYGFSIHIFTKWWKVRVRDRKAIKIVHLNDIYTEFFTAVERDAKNLKSFVQTLFAHIEVSKQ